MILITGVAGFIGSNFLYYYLVKYPEREIIGLDKLTYAGNLENLSKLTKLEKNRFKFFSGDINDFELLEKLFEKYEIDSVINFAAESHVDKSIENPRVFLETNVLGTQTLLNTCKSFWIKGNKIADNMKFLQISTDEVYGSLESEGYFTEKTPLDPRSPYSASKASADFLVKAYYDTFDLPINITRCSNNYGPYQFPEKLIPLMINNALNHKKLPIYGDGKQIRDWLHVSDHCNAVDLVFEKGKIGEIYNVGGHCEKENIIVVEKLIQILNEITSDKKINSDLVEFVEDRLGHDRRYAIDPSKIQKELGWKNSVDFEDGLRRTVLWYLENRKWLDNILTKRYLTNNKEMIKEFNRYS